MTDQPTPAHDEAARDDRQPAQLRPSGEQMPGEREPSAVPPAAEPAGETGYGQQPEQTYGPPYGSPAQPYAGAYGQPYAGPPYGGQPSGGPAGTFSAYGQPAYYVMPREPKVLSITSLCCGIAVFLGFGFILLPQLAAVILGHLALSREPAGRGMAIAGLVLGYIGIALTALVILLFAVAVGTFRSTGYAI